MQEADRSTQNCLPSRADDRRGFRRAEITQRRAWGILTTAAIFMAGCDDGIKWTPTKTTQKSSPISAPAAKSRGGDVPDGK